MSRVMQVFAQYVFGIHTVAMFPWWIAIMIFIVLMVFLCCSQYTPKKRHTIQERSSDEGSNKLKLFGYFTRKYPDVRLSSDDSSSAVWGRNVCADLGKRRNPSGLHFQAKIVHVDRSERTCKEITDLGIHNAVKLYRSGSGSIYHQKSAALQHYRRRHSYHTTRDLEYRKSATS